MKAEIIYDLIGIGIGPFNLGLAALAAEIPELNCLFIDKDSSFNWHPGMMLPTAKMQVPFLADLVTLADPRSKYSYLNYLKAVGRLFKFVINENYVPYRSEYNKYCRWVATQLTNLHFGHCCTQINFNRGKEIYTICATNREGAIICFHAKHIVVGIGSEPLLPPCIKKRNYPGIYHSSDYLTIKAAALMRKRITLVGSGQSAAEVFSDLLAHIRDIDTLHWFTRSERFHPMEYSKLTLEMSTPEYIHYFYALDESTKGKILSRQQYLFKGINASLIDEIYNQLYLLDLDKPSKLPAIQVNTELQDIIHNQHGITLQLRRNDTHLTFDHNTDAVILATGYKPAEPKFLGDIQELINRSGDKLLLKQNYAVDDRNTIYLQNADLHSHGFNSADLSLGPYRNAIILNTILKYRYFQIDEAGNTFQQFSL
jgi:lysine N6-hydroxylase